MTRQEAFDEQDAADVYADDVLANNGVGRYLMESKDWHLLGTLYRRKVNLMEHLFSRERDIHHRIKESCSSSI